MNGKRWSIRWKRRPLNINGVSLLGEIRGSPMLSVLSSRRSSSHRRLPSQGKRAGALSFLHMCLAVLEKTLPDERLAEQELDVFLSPVLGWQGLQEHHDLLEIHFAELVRPFDEEGGAHVEVEGGEALVFSLRIDGWLALLYSICESAVRVALTRYVSHILIVFFTLISRMRRQFIHLKLNWMNSTPSRSMCLANVPSILAVRSRNAATCRWMPG